MTDSSSIGNRLKSYFKVKNFKQNAVAQRIDVSAGFLSRVLNDEEEITAKVIFGLSKSYAELNINWLISGNGEMLVEQMPKFIQANEDTAAYETPKKKPLNGLELLLEDYGRRIDALENDVTLLRKEVERLNRVTK